ncbi:hypothetical protein C8Q73DRAFT_817838 [Cubamyces lactineus]|nr:hypothetical protein C8Q73DRAFT_817838 [Cubamyces lactineus]
MSTTPSPTLVDDSDPHVQYLPGWKWEQGVAELDGTRHGAALTGLTCSLAFVGTGIRVVGTLEASDKSGQPQTTYEIDGVVVGAYNAPFTRSTTTEYNVTFFETHGLPPGDHSILINNTNGTSPNVFWLDYFLIDLSPQSQIPSPTPFSSTQSSSGDTEQTGSIVTPGTNAGPTSSISVAGQTQATKPSDSSSKSHVNVGAIAGGVVPFDFAGDRFMSSARHQSMSTQPTLVKDTNSPQSMTEYSSITAPSDRLPSILMAVGGHQELAQRSPTTGQPSTNPESMTGAGSFAANAVAASHHSGSSVMSLPHPTPYSLPASGKDSSLPELTTTSHPSTTPLWDSSTGSPVPSSAHPTSASAVFPVDAPLVTPVADIPPGEWHAPPAMENRAQALLQSFVSRSRSGNTPVVHDVDSGLRLYDDVVMPPPYTPD